MMRFAFKTAPGEKAPQVEESDHELCAGVEVRGAGGVTLNTSVWFTYA